MVRAQAVATAMVAVFQFQRLDFASVFTTSDFSAIESDSWMFVMVNFANLDGLCGFRGLERQNAGEDIPKSARFSGLRRVGSNVVASSS